MTEALSIYEEHFVAELHGIRIADATSRIENHEHDDVIWLGCMHGDGVWLSVAQLLNVEEKIRGAIDCHLARKGLQRRAAA